MSDLNDAVWLEELAHGTTTLSREERVMLQQIAGRVVASTDAQHADAERVRGVVRDAFEMVVGSVNGSPERTLRNDLADRVAAKLVAPVLRDATVPRDAYCARDDAAGCELHPRGCPGSALASAAALSAEERNLVIEVCHDLINRAMRNEADENPDPHYSTECRAKEAAIRHLLGGGR